MHHPLQLAYWLYSKIVPVHRLHKQTNAYNVSIERGCFSRLASLFPDTRAQNIWLVADNINTLLIDDSIVSPSHGPSPNLNFLVNVKHLILAPDSLQGLDHVQIEFLTQPRVLRLPMGNNEPATTARHIALVCKPVDRIRELSVVF